MDRLTFLFENRVGQPFDDKRIAEIRKLGEIRYEAEIPPGYADRKKPDPARFGDLILWMQLLDHIEREQRPVIFVTDDVKDDWWLRCEGQTIGPRPELIAELRERAGQLFHMYRAEQFARYARNYSKAGISDTALDEIDHLADKQEEDKIVDKAREILKERQAHLATRLQHLLRNVEISEASVKESAHLHESAIVEMASTHGRRSNLATHLAELEGQHEVLLIEVDTLNHRAIRYADNDDRKIEILNRLTDVQGELREVSQKMDRVNSSLKNINAASKHVEVIRHRLERAREIFLREMGRAERAKYELTQIEDLLAQ